MNKYIPADKLIAKIERRKYEVFPTDDGKVRVCTTPNQIQSGWLNALKWVCETILSLQQEQPEVDLGKFTEKIKTFQERYKYPEIVSIKGAMAFMARMFYQYPNVARRWYDGLSKATMDDARKEERMIEIIEKFDRVWHPMEVEMPSGTAAVELKKKDGSIIDSEIYVDISGHFIYHDGGWHSTEEYTHWRFKDTVVNRRKFRKED